jgi:NAD-dependent SIR2 family protein deacetylase
MGVDSGLPDFRGSEGFWRAYPALGRAQIGFSAIACPDAFEEHPDIAWGFYGHRLRLYRETVPHEGFQLLRQWASTLPHGAFVFTSNVDGQFQKDGFPANRIVEIHGSIHYLQCLSGCWGEIWPADDFQPLVDDEHCLLTSTPPTCAHCGGLARPNILMFGDGNWLDHRTRVQQAELTEWRRKVDRLLVIELGAGTAIPFVRLFSEHAEGPIIRINPRESKVGSGRNVALPIGALEGLRGIQAALEEAEFL